MSTVHCTVCSVRPQLWLIIRFTDIFVKIDRVQYFAKLSVVLPVIGIEREGSWSIIGYPIKSCIWHLVYLKICWIILAAHWLAWLSIVDIALIQYIYHSPSLTPSPHLPWLSTSIQHLRSLSPNWKYIHNINSLSRVLQITVNLLPIRSKLKANVYLAQQVYQVLIWWTGICG